MTAHDSHNSVPTGARWRKASYSNGNGGNCVEVAGLRGRRRAVRDSKHLAGPVLTVTAAQWAAFTAGIRTGELG